MQPVKSGNMQLLNFVLDTQAPVGPSTVLDPGSDTGTFNNDNITNDNNSTTTPSNAPVFDVGTATNPIAAGSTVSLYRTPVNPDGTAIVGGAAGAGQYADEHGWRGRADRRHQPAASRRCCRRPEC